jgi:hypothetical protein
MFPLLQRKHQLGKWVKPKDELVAPRRKDIADDRLRIQALKALGFALKVSTAASAVAPKRKTSMTAFGPEWNLTFLMVAAFSQAWPWRHHSISHSTGASLSELTTTTKYTALQCSRKVQRKNSSLSQWIATQRTNTGCTVKESDIAMSTVPIQEIESRCRVELLRIAHVSAMLPSTATATAPPKLQHSVDGESSHRSSPSGRRLKLPRNANDFTTHGTI